MTVPIPSESSDRPRSVASAFLVGAPRCGTTFLAKTLAAHPNVCFSKPKETHFFVRDALSIPQTRWRETFLARYFASLGPDHRLIVEGSPLQLRDPDAIERLLAFDPETRFLVAVRSPIDLIHSFHARLLFLLDEDERDFERAWDLQAARARGERIPKRCRDAASLQYRAMASIGTQLGRLIERVGRGRVHVVVFDDVAVDPVKVYRGLLEFLELPDDGRIRFSKKNENRAFRH
ncbi:sulfotransferase, partial [Myxococcota bacterium]|nr:sulfotransferase [Myxococcota bacterium]